MKKFINKIKNNKTLSILSILIIGIFFLLITRVTFAFLAPIFNSAQTDVMGASDTVDDFKFELGNPLKIDATPTTLKENGTNYVTSTTAKALLKANSTQNTATYNYYVYFLIKSNTFTYSDGSTPEIILTVTDPNGDEITSIDGLTYGTFNGVSGFDVTTKKGLFNIANNYEITSNSSTTYTTQSWTIKITYLNLSIDQSTNFGNSMGVNVYITKNEKKLTVADICSNGQTLNSCIIAMDGKDDTLYHHTSTLTNGAGDNSYRYAGGDYVLTDAGKATGATMMIGYNNTVTTALIDFYCNGTKQYVGYGCSSSQAHYYLIKGATIQYQSYNEALNASVEKGYLTKDNVKNFVCFGSDATTCPTDNLYRIIGVFNNQVKLIKWDYAKSSLLGTDGDFSSEYSYYLSGEQGESPSSNSLYCWNKATGINTWSKSNLNKVNLNTNYINNIGSTWANKIATTTWKVGGNTWDNIAGSTPTEAYQNEIVNPVPGQYSTTGETEYEAKIGLMYVSDYYYAASPIKWTLVGYNSDYSKSYASAKGENWLYGGGRDWTISRRSDVSNYAFLVEFTGNVAGLNVDGSLGARPSFNLESSITYVSGSGSMSDPIVIN